MIITMVYSCYSGIVRVNEIDHEISCFQSLVGGIVVVAFLFYALTT